MTIGSPAESFVDKDEATDEDLAARCPTEFDLLYSRYAHRVLALIARKVGRGAAEDLAQQTWLAVARHLPKEFKPSLFKPWLFLIAKNQCLDWFRSQRRQPVLRGAIELESTVSAQDGQAEGQALDSLQHNALKSCLERLSAKAREVFSRRWAGDDYPAIAEALGVTIGTCYKLLHEATGMLRDCVQQRLSEP